MGCWSRRTVGGLVAVSLVGGLCGLATAHTHGVYFHITRLRAREEVCCGQHRVTWCITYAWQLV